MTNNTSKTATVKMFPSAESHSLNECVGETTKTLGKAAMQSVHTGVATIVETALEANACKSVKCYLFAHHISNFTRRFTRQK